MKKSFDVHLTFDTTAYPEPKWGLHAFDMSSISGYVSAGKRTVEVDVPDDFDPTPAQVTQLKAERERVSKEFGAKLMDLDNQIGKLLCLNNEVPA